MINIQTPKRVSGKAKASAIWMVLLLAVAWLLPLGCKNPVQMWEAPGMGTFSLTIDGGTEQRTILPSANGFARFELEFAPKGGGQTIKQTWTSTAGSVELFPGTWNLTVDAFMQAEGGTARASGTLEVTVTAGVAASGNIRLVPASSEGRGTFSWDIAFPEGLQVFQMGVREINGDYNWDGYFVDKGQQGNTIIDNPGSRQLPSGHYTVDFSGYDTSGRGFSLQTLVLHVYDNMESQFQFDFTQDFFTVTMERRILDAWDGTRWNFTAKGIEVGHFEIAGISGVTEGNFTDMVQRFTTLQTVAGGTPSNLGLLVDAAFMEIASEDADFLNAANYWHKTNAQDTIAGLLRNV